MPTANLVYNAGGGSAGPDALERYGPTLYVHIGYDPSYDPERSVRPRLPDESRLALLDTGASQSCIDESLALELGLPVFERRQLGGVHGLQEVNFYPGQIYVPALRHTISGVFAGVRLRASGQPHFALIGRNFLRHFTMTYEGRTGTVTLSND